MLSRPVNAGLDVWIAWRFHGMPPSGGGWLETPLALLVRCAAMNVVYDAWRNFRDEKFDWNKFTAYERALCTWLEKEVIMEYA